VLFRSYLPNGDPTIAVSIVMANFPKSTATKPALLKFNDVNTFFHEFGHALHAFLGRTQMASFAGTSVKIDFVEMPSQILEEWLADKKILKMVGRHYQMGKTLPDDLIESLLKTKTYDSGLWTKRQLVFAKLSLSLFDNGENIEIEKFMKNTYEQIINYILFDPRNHDYASFGHLMGYGARYYGYLWSKVFALDLFNEIKKKGLLNAEIGRRYRDTIIGKGGSKDPNELLFDFLGREPNDQAFLKDMGLMIENH
jgi:thimet oligopeptidase